jgi:adenosyl cobinamide kinase/adenosyl cobinamide phosphate guanylyltransferase
MVARIAEHRAQRGPEWQTIDAPRELPAAISAAPARPLLVDCLMLWSGVMPRAAG